MTIAEFLMRNGQKIIFLLKLMKKLFVLCAVKRFQFLKNLISNDIMKRNIENNFAI